MASPFSEEHEIFRNSVRAFFKEHLTPNVQRWEEAGMPDRDFWRKAGVAGILAAAVPEEYGGAGGDFLHHIVLVQELGSSIGGACIGVGMHTDNLIFHLLRFGAEEQKKEWLPKVVRGETVMSICMTEPGGGSDVQRLSTKAIRSGDDYILNGAKTYVTNGAVADMAIVAAKTDPALDAKGISLFLVDTKLSGFQRGKRLDKMGMRAGDTLELFFDDVRVPATQLLGEEGQGFAILMSELPRERIVVATRALAEAQLAFDLTLAFVKDRKIFGKPLMEYQNTQFVLASLKAELMVGNAYLNECLVDASQGILDNTKAAVAKLWITEMQGRVVDQCLQLHGGAGYMAEQYISKLYTSARVMRIFGGASEVMRMLIARSL